MSETIQDIFPKPYKGVQVNYCVSTGCENFGISDASLYQVAPERKGLNIYLCPKCGAYPQIIDNRAIYEMLAHQKQYHSLKLTSCPNEQCIAHTLAVHANPSIYRAFGKTNTLKQRYQCSTCQSVFTDQFSFSTSNSEIQNAMFYGMMYSFGIRNICQKLAITPKTFYKHQHVMVERLKYIAHVKEAFFFRQTEDINLATSYRFIGKNNSALMVATADMVSGYILGFDTNITTNISTECLLETKSTQRSYTASISAIEERGDIIKDINEQYDVIMARSNFLDPTSDGREVAHYYRGVLIQPYLNSFAHALVLRQKLQNKGQRCYFVKQDTMLRNAFLNSALQDLLHSNDHLFYYCESSEPLAWFNQESLNIRYIGWWKDKWGFIDHQGNIKGACHIKGQSLSTEKWQSLLEQATLTGVEHYLDVSMSFFEGLGTTLSEQSINDWLHIYTGYYNFCLPYRDGKTPAQLLGIIDRPVAFGELLNGIKLN